MSSSSRIDGGLGVFNIRNASGSWSPDGKVIKGKTDAGQNFRAKITRRDSLPEAIRDLLKDTRVLVVSSGADTFHPLRKKTSTEEFSKINGLNLPLDPHIKFSYPIEAIPLSSTGFIFGLSNFDHRPPKLDFDLKNLSDIEKRWVANRKN